MNRDVVICGYARTPVGSYQGTLSPFSAGEFGAMAIRKVIDCSGLQPEVVDEVIMGCVLTGGQGQVPGRRVWLKSGLPNDVGTITDNWCIRLRSDGQRYRPTRRI